MKTNSEKGHGKNVANFGHLITFCSGYGADYNPTKESIKPAALAAKYTEALNSLDTLNEKLPAYSKAVHDRERLFAPLSKFVTRIVLAATIADTSKQLMVDVKNIARKLKGSRAKAIDNTPPVDPGNPGSEAHKKHSVSQLSFDNRIDNMDKLIKVLGAIPGYKPNETDLSIAGLNRLLTDMKTVNTETLNAYVDVSNQRINRNKILYAHATGLVDIALDVKIYIQSAFGHIGPQHKQVSKYKFIAFKI